jgi:hypothetical protein
MFNKTGSDKTLYDRDSADRSTIYADLSGGIILASAIKVKARASSEVPVSFTVSGIVALRVPLKADMAVGLTTEATNIFTHARLFPNPLTIGGTVTAALGARMALSSDVSVGAGFTSEYLKARTKLSAGTVPIGMNITVNRMGLRFPIAPSEIPVGGDFVGNAAIRVPVTPLEIDITGDIKCAPIFEPGAAKLELENLNLAPGGELIIDTDVLEVLLNGEPDVDMVTGDSEFFELKPGNNRIVFMDGETGRQLDVSIVWSNRWL